MHKAIRAPIIFNLVNIPNAVTLSRIPLMLTVVALLAYHPFAGAHTVALAIFLSAALTDWLDGWLARRMGQTSTFGKFMDALSDKIFVLGMFVALLALLKELQWALFPILLILSREFLVTGLRLAAVVLAAESAGKVKTVLQLCCLSLLLAEQALIHDWRLAFPGTDESSLLEWVSIGAAASLVLATVVTVTSGIGYMQRHGDLFFGKQSE